MLESISSPVGLVAVGVGLRPAVAAAAVLAVWPSTRAPLIWSRDLSTTGPEEVRSSHFVLFNGLAGVIVVRNLNDSSAVPTWGAFARAPLVGAPAWRQGGVVAGQKTCPCKRVPMCINASMDNGIYLLWVAITQLDSSFWLISCQRSENQSLPSGTLKSSQDKF